MVSLKQLFEWFTTGKFPTEAQFAEQFKSFWHKSEKIAMPYILGLVDALNGKAEKSEINALAIGLIYKPPVPNVPSLDTTYPNAEKGWACKVLDQKDDNENSYIYQFDGNSWNNTGLIAFPDDVATQKDVAQLERGIDPFSVLDVTGCGVYSPIDIVFTQGGYYNQKGELTNNQYWEYAIIPIDNGIYNFSGLSVGDGTVSPLMLMQGENIVKIFKNNISGINVELSQPIDSIIVSRYIGGNGAIGVYSRYVDKNKLTDNTQKTSIFRDIDTNSFYHNVLLDLKIDGIQLSETLYLSTLYNKDNANQINVTKSGGSIVCNYYKDGKESGIKEVVLSEYQNSGYSGKAIIDFDLLYNASLPTPLYPVFNSDVIKNDSLIRNRTNIIHEKIDDFPFLDSGLFAHRKFNVGAIEGLYLRTTDNSPVPVDNFYFSRFIKLASSTQITIEKRAANGLETVVANFWIGSSLKGTQVLKLSEFQNSKIEGYIRVNFDKIEPDVNYEDKTSVFDKKRVFNPQLFFDVYSSIATLSSGLIGKKGQTILTIGDSLSVLGKWQKKVAEMLGVTIRNHALGGAGIKQMIDGFRTLPALSVEHVTGVDVIVLYGGYNNRNLEYGQLGDVDNNTIIGLIQYAVNRIYELLKEANNLQCKIVIVTPHCGGKYEWSDVDGYTETPVGSGRTLKTMANAIKDVSNFNSLPCIDLWHHSGINKFTWDKFQLSPVANNPQYIGKFPTADVLPTSAISGDRAKVEDYGGSYRYDGTSWSKDEAPYPWNEDQLHLNDEGYEKIGEYIARCLNVI